MSVEALVFYVYLPNAQITTARWHRATALHTDPETGTCKLSTQHPHNSAQGGLFTVPRNDLRTYSS